MAYGNPPYHESSLKSALRLAAAGLGSVPRGANFGTAFLAAAGGASRAYGAAQQAAQEYALKQQQMQEQQDMNEFTKAHLKAQTDALSRQKEPPPPKLEPWQLPQDQQDKIIAFETRKAAGLAKVKRDSMPPKPAAVPMSDQALNEAADLYATTGVLTGFGMGNTADRNLVRNRAALRHPNTDIAANSAAFKTNQGALKTLQQVRDLSGGWENTVIANGNVMMEAMKHIPEAGNMPMNYILRHGATMFGSDKMAAFNTARETLKNEAARLLNQPGGTGGAVLSDAARREVEKIASGNLTGRQMQASFNILKRDALNKRTGYDRQIQQIRGRIKSRFGVSPDLNLDQLQQQQQQEQSAPTNWVYDPDTGEMTPAQ